MAKTIKLATWNTCPGYWHGFVDSLMDYRDGAGVLEHSVVNKHLKRHRATYTMDDVTQDATLAFEDDNMFMLFVLRYS